jgi:hypothetical protein
VEETSSLQSINRLSQRRYITVGATLAEGENVTLLTTKAQAVIKKLDLGTGVTYAFTGENETIMEAVEQLGLMLLLGVPILYNYRMVNYIIVDKPAIGALMALRESKIMMRGHRMELLKLDISLWWYHLAFGGITVLCYLDMLLPMMGVELPVSETVAYFVSYGLYLAASFAVQFFLRNRVEVAYALAYDAVKPEEQQSGGVVLGNIFQM